ncbi:hypothetical protein ABBQ32_007026 [Trebouxia sp. C0010 RCD-2024]
MLEEATSQSLCDFDSYIEVTFDPVYHHKQFFAKMPWHITCHKEHQSVLFTLSQIKKQNGPCIARHHDGRLIYTQLVNDVGGWPDMSKDQLWHRLAGAPPLRSAKFDCHSQGELARLRSLDQHKALAQLTFNFLCTSNGVLRVGMQRPAEEVEHTRDEYWLIICHTIEPMGFSTWKIDGEASNVDPPHIMFDDVPEKVTLIKAVFRSHQLSEQQYLEEGPLDKFGPERQARFDFAYKGNVDMDAWKEKGSERSRMAALAHHIFSSVPLRLAFLKECGMDQ